MIKHIAVFVSLCAAGAAYAADYKVGTIAIDHPWVRPTVEGTKTGAAYLLLANKGTAPDKLVSASSPVAGKTQIHQTTDEGGVMKMHETCRVDWNHSSGSSKRNQSTRNRQQTVTLRNG